VVEEFRETVMFFTSDGAYGRVMFRDTEVVEF
jgi:hypothetical protein